MKLNVYVIRDQRTCFMTPTFDYNDQSAIRNFEHAVLQKESLFNSHAEDYSIYRIGEYDNQTGIISPEVSPVLILDGKDFGSFKEVH
uniref:Nonstructural protein n=1 Tax=Dulem virus 104 TaxID=3145581 RepID=A0AAU8B9V3_9VIRU